MTKPRMDEITQELSRGLIDAGRLIEAGFVAFRTLVIPKDAHDYQVQDMRVAFFAGAQHLFASIMQVLDPGEEPSEADLKRMDKIDAELKRFIAEMELRMPTKGSA